MTSDAERVLYARVQQRMFAATFGPCAPVGTLPVVTLTELTQVLQQAVADGCDCERTARRILRRYGGSVLAKVEAVV